MSKDNNTISSPVIDSEYEGYIGLVKQSVRVKDITTNKVVYGVGDTLYEMSLGEFESTFTRVIYE